MRVVSNTSPLSNLAIIHRLDLVREAFGEVIVPPAVEVELSRLPHPAACHRLLIARQEGWLRVEPLAGNVPADFANELDAGEAEALALAMQSKARLVLLDETAARVKARQLGLPHTGVLGLLRHARQSARIPSLKNEMIRLRLEARFFIHPALERSLLASVGET